MKDKEQFNQSISETVIHHCKLGSDLPGVLLCVAAGCIGLKREFPDQHDYYQAAADELLELSKKLEKIDRKAKY